MPQFRAVLQGIWTQPQAQALKALHHRHILAQVRLPEQLLRQVQAMATCQKLLYQLMHQLQDTLSCPWLKPRPSQLLNPLCMLGLIVWRLQVRLASPLKKVTEGQVLLQAEALRAPGATTTSNPSSVVTPQATTPKTPLGLPSRFYSSGSSSSSIGTQVLGMRRCTLTHIPATPALQVMGGMAPQDMASRACMINQAMHIGPKFHRHRMGMMDSRIIFPPPSSSPGGEGQTAPATQTPTPVIFILANIMLACSTLVSTTLVTCCMPSSSFISSIP